MKNFGKKTFFISIAVYILLLIPCYLAAFGNDEGKRNPGAQLNPTGTYKMGTRSTDNYNMTNKSRGEIRIKKINNTKIAIALYAIIGYDVADLVDTLTFKNGKAVYQGNGSDSTCRIYFEFSRSKVLVKQTSNERPSPCGFGWNADASGTYRKQSAKVPIITDLAKVE